VEGKMLDDRVVEKAREILTGLDRPVRLAVFTQEAECTYCQQNKELIEDIAGLSDKISYDVYDLIQDDEQSRKYGIDKVPAVVVTAENKDYGIRFFGVPSGYEFTSLLDAIRTVSTGKHELSAETVSRIEKLDKPVHIQVFVTPTCPYCPKAVILAHRLALFSSRISSDMVEAIEFPHLAQKYSVSGVPRSVINETKFVEGAVPEQVLVERILEP
jgi:glutaredoxin-like protein